MSALSTWTIYDHPADDPARFVVVEWQVSDGGEPVRFWSHAYDTLDQARDFCQETTGGMPLTRDPGDDPTIVETWM